MYFFFFKQKTAYEMRISDWSSDVCSSDLVFAVFVPGVGQSIAQGGRYDDIGADFGRARPATGFSTDLKTLVTLGRAEVELPSGGIRSEERRVGKECVSTCRSWWSPDH